MTDAPCQTLDDIIFPLALNTIGNLAFYNCTALQTVNLPSQINGIGTYAFDHTGLKTIDFPLGVATVGDHFFTNCPDLRDVYLRDNITGFTGNPFENSPNVIIHCTMDSAAYNFAVENGIPYVLDDTLKLTVCVYLDDHVYTRYYDLDTPCVVYAVVYDANGGMLGLDTLSRTSQDSYIELQPEIRNAGTVQRV